MKTIDLLLALCLSASAAALPANVTLTTSGEITGKTPVASINATVATKGNAIVNDTFVMNLTKRFDKWDRYERLGGFEYRYNHISLVTEPLDRDAIFLDDYTIKEFFITPGQDPDLHNKVGDVKVFKEIRNLGPHIGFLCGRHGSKYAAKWWNDRFQGHHPPGCHLGWFRTCGPPEKLNFAFVGDLRGRYRAQGQILSFTIPDLGLAQGHMFGNNNWWIGSLAGSIDANDRMAINIRLEDPPACFSFRRGDHGSANYRVFTLNIRPYQDCF